MREGSRRLVDHSLAPGYLEAEVSFWHHEGIIGGGSGIKSILECKTHVNLYSLTLVQARVLIGRNLDSVIPSESERE